MPSSAAPKSNAGANGPSKQPSTAVPSTAIPTSGDIIDDVETDLTVISQSPLLSTETAYAGLRPRELGAVLVGQRLSDVLLEEYIGGGGMGAVFRGRDLALHRTVAVKVLSTYQTSDAEGAKRFGTEARSAARLDHPHIARVHYVGEERGLRYIVFEYIEGTNLRELIIASGPLTLPQALSYTLQIADALVHAWQRTVVHRDIKPSNILITSDGQAKLVDMGLARLEHVEQAEHEMTATGATLGTFDYIPPEQARNPRDADTRSDIYSLGCTLYYMLAGQPPFPDGTAVQKLLRHQHDPPPDVRQFRPEAPVQLSELLGRMLAKRPEDRFQNPVELAAALVALADQLNIARPALATNYYPPSTAARNRFWSTHAPWLIPVLMLVAAILALGYLQRPTGPPSEFEPLNVPDAVAPASP
ncbi:MAG: serine/threonine-protein kinase [Pirellulales bacterium]